MASEGRGPVVDLSPHLAALRADLSAAAAVGGDDVARAAALLGDAVEPALRLVLLDLLTEAADELSGQLPGASIELRLRGREPELVVAAVPVAPLEADAAGEEGTARLTLRLPEALKLRVEAAAGAEGQSVNSWLVRAVTAAVEPRGSFPFTSTTGGPLGPRRLTGFGRA